MCQSPKYYSDSVSVLNLMLFLSFWIWGHSTVKQKLQMIKKIGCTDEMRHKLDVHKIRFQTCLHGWFSICWHWEQMAVLEEFYIFTGRASLGTQIGLQKCKREKNRLYIPSPLNLMNLYVTCLSNIIAGKIIKS